MLNMSSIRSIAKDSEESQTIFNSLAKRKRTRRITDLRQLQYKLSNEGEKITREGVMRTFQALQDAGVGSVIIGRKGKPTRFKWDYSVKRVAQAGIKVVKVKKTKEEPAFVAPVISKKSRKMTTSEFSEKVRALAPANIASESIQAVISTTIKIRNNFSSKIELPLDLKREDIDELSKILYSLVQVKSDPAPKEMPAPEVKETASEGLRIQNNNEELKSFHSS
jgi:hypothetical protein